MNTWFLPIDPVYRESFEAWVANLRDDLLFGHDDPLFPPPEMGLENGRFAVTGLSRTPYATAGSIREVIKSAFTSGGLPVFAHSFRKTIVKWGVDHYTTPEALKAFSQNIGQRESAVDLQRIFAGVARTAGGVNQDASLMQERSTEHWAGSGHSLRVRNLNRRLAYAAIEMKIIVRSFLHFHKAASKR